MKNNMIISYDLNSPGQDYERLINVIKSFEKWAKVQQSVWYIKTSIDIKSVAKQLWSNMDSNDSLFIVDTTNNSSYWYNISERSSKYIQENWNQ